MTGKLTLIDSDALIGILRKERIPYKNARTYLSMHGSFNISCITWYECYRGYQILGAVKRLQEFQELMSLSQIHYFDESLMTRAAGIYTSLHKQGKLTGEFDLLIGATALQNNWNLATNNEKHYQAMADDFGLEIKNWMTTSF
jgi:tRNA(fMet)-specific endonuclease VapC